MLYKCNRCGEDTFKSQELIVTSDNDVKKIFCNWDCLLVFALRRAVKEEDY